MAGHRDPAIGRTPPINIRKRPARRRRNHLDRGTTLAPRARFIRRGHEEKGSDPTPPAPQEAPVRLSDRWAALVSDIRSGVRQLRAAPVLSVVLIATLGFGI